MHGLACHALIVAIGMFLAFAIMATVSMKYRRRWWAGMGDPLFWSVILGGMVFMAHAIMTWPQPPK